MTIRDSIALLLGRKSPPLPDPSAPIPTYLQAKYHREGAARELGMLEAPDVDVLAALIRAAILDEEEDVRQAALQSLLAYNVPVIPVILVACTYDSYGGLRALALEELGLRDANMAQEIARRLQHDPDDEVRDVASDIIEAAS